MVVKQRCSFAIFLGGRWSILFRLPKHTRYRDGHGEKQKNTHDDKGEYPLEGNDFREQLPQGQCCLSLAGSLQMQGLLTQRQDRKLEAHCVIFEDKQIKNANGQNAPDKDICHNSRR